MREIHASRSLASRFEEALETLEEGVPALFPILHAKVGRFSAAQSRHGVIEIGHDLVVFLVRDPAAPFILQIGFPFALAQREAPQFALPGYAIRICLRGEPIHKLQRDSLAAAWGYDLRILEEAEFRARIQRCAEGRQRGLFINPYTYLGDSIISLHMLRRIQRAYRLPDTLHCTHFAEHHSGLGPALPFDPDLLLQEMRAEDLAIVPNLLEVHQAELEPFLANTCLAGIPALVLGRNLAIFPDERLLIGLARPNPLLRDKNIEDYMEDCLAPFLPLRTAPLPELPPSLHTVPAAKTALINPYTSTADRDLPPGFVLNVIEALQEIGYNRVLVSRGAPASQKDRQASSELEQQLSLCSGITIEYASFGTLTEMVQRIRAAGVSTAISADTAIPHLCNHLGLPVYTVFLPDIADPESVQSLATSSFLGFCRYALTQIPIVPTGSLTECDTSLLASFFQENELGQSPCPPDLRVAYRASVARILDAPAERLSDSIAEALEWHRNIVRELRLESWETLFPLKTHLALLLELDLSTVRWLCYSLFRVSPQYKRAMRQSL